MKATHMGAAVRVPGSRSQPGLTLTTAGIRGSESTEGEIAASLARSLSLSCPFTLSDCLSSNIFSKNVIYKHAGEYNSG